MEDDKGRLYECYSWLVQVEGRSEGKGRRGGMDGRRELREGERSKGEEGGRKEKRRGEGSEEDNYGGGR